jgi:ribonucleoside-diphosphate reductase alpha chain
VKNGVIDWELLADKTKLATRFLDDLIDVNKYVVGVPQLEEAAKKSRRIGLGIMGLADMLILCDCGYGSKKGNELSSKVMEWIRYNCMIESIKLSKEIEPFLSIKGSIYDPNDLKWKPPKPLLPYEYDFGRPEFSWNIVVDGIKKYGIRNAAQTTVAPTGTISTVFGNEGYGCEPIFAFGYTRNVINGDDNLILEYNSDLFKKAINNIKNMDSKVKKSILSTVSNKGSCKDINQLPQDIKDIFVCAKDLSVDQHVILQASLQAFVDNSMSKTCNCPEYTTVEKISDVYLSAWKLGCKGITVYRESSRNKVVLETREVTKNKSKKIQNNNEIKESLFGVTTHLPSSYGTINVTLNQDGQGNPHEIFINVGKSGSSLLAVGECIGRLVSYILKNAPSDKTPAEALIDVIKQLKGIGGSNPNGLGVKRVESIPDGIAIALSKNLLKLCEINNTKNCENLLSDSIDFSEYFNKDQGKRETKKTKEIKDLSNKHLTKSYSDNMLIRRKDMCPECGQVMLYVSGCGTCTDCGYEKCK